MTELVEQQRYAPGSVVIVRDEEWMVESIDSDGPTTWLHVRGLGELVKDTTAFSQTLDTIHAHTYFTSLLPPP